MRAHPITRAGRTHGLPAPAALVAAVLVVPLPAFAHGNLAVGDFYTGLLQPVFHFDSLLPAVVIALWSSQLGDAEVWRLPVVFMAAALAGSVAAALGWQIEGTAWVPRVAMLVLGLLVAARLRLPPLVALALGLGAGFAQGYVAVFGERETITRPILYILGMCSGVGLICFHLESLVLRFSAFWVQIAVRVLGSWIAAIGLLVAVLGAMGGGRGTG